MNKDFWAAITNNNYQIPDGHTLQELTGALFSYLPSLDPELRDEIAYTVYANWLEQELYSREEISAHIKTLLPNLATGIDEAESDSVFLRAFSVLFLAEIVHNDNKKPLLDPDQVRSILERGLWYLEAEKDPRGHVPVKGWAHALAHTADLMLVLGRNRYLDAEDLQKILDAISSKMSHSIHYLYIHGEDERLASAVIEILRRKLIPLDRVEAWATSFLQPDGKDWKGAFLVEERSRALQNTRNLLRSIYLGLLFDQEEMSDKESLSDIFFNMLKSLKPY